MILKDIFFKLTAFHLSSKIPDILKISADELLDEMRNLVIAYLQYHRRINDLETESVKKERQELIAAISLFTNSGKLSSNKFSEIITLLESTEISEKTSNKYAEIFKQTKIKQTFYMLLIDDIDAFNKTLKLLITGKTIKDTGYLTVVYKTAVRMRELLKLFEEKNQSEEVKSKIEVLTNLIAFLLAFTSGEETKKENLRDARTNNNDEKLLLPLIAHVLADTTLPVETKIYLFDLALSVEKLSKRELSKIFFQYQYDAKLLRYFIEKHQINPFEEKNSESIFSFCKDKSELIKLAFQHLLKNKEVSSLFLLINKDASRTIAALAIHFLENEDYQSLSLLVEAYPFAEWKEEVFPVNYFKENFANLSGLVNEDDKEMISVFVKKSRNIVIHCVFKQDTRALTILSSSAPSREHKNFAYLNMIAAAFPELPEPLFEAFYKNFKMNSHSSEMEEIYCELVVTFIKRGIPPRLIKEFIQKSRVQNSVDIISYAIVYNSYLGKNKIELFIDYFNLLLEHTDSITMLNENTTNMAKKQHMSSYVRENGLNHFFQSFRFFIYANGNNTQIVSAMQKFKTILVRREKEQVFSEKNGHPLTQFQSLSRFENCIHACIFYFLSHFGYGKDLENLFRVKGVANEVKLKLKDENDEVIKNETQISSQLQDPSAQSRKNIDKIISVKINIPQGLPNESEQLLFYQFMKEMMQLAPRYDWHAKENTIGSYHFDSTTLVITLNDKDIFNLLVENKIGFKKLHFVAATILDRSAFLEQMFAHTHQLKKEISLDFFKTIEYAVLHDKVDCVDVFLNALKAYTKPSDVKMVNNVLENAFELTTETQADIRDRLRQHIDDLELKEQIKEHHRIEFKKIKENKTEEKAEEKSDDVNNNNQQQSNEVKIDEITRYTKIRFFNGKRNRDATAYIPKKEWKQIKYGNEETFKKSLDLFATGFGRRLIAMRDPKTDEWLIKFRGHGDPRTMFGLINNNKDLISKIDPKEEVREDMDYYISDTVLKHE